MRKLVLYLLATLALSIVVQAHPTPHGYKEENQQHQERRMLPVREAPLVEKSVSKYRAVTKWENKKNIALGVAGALVALVTLGVAGMRVTEDRACQAVAKQQRVMQAAWDEVHPDGFVAVGDGMRPADFDCNAQERKFKPLKSYGNAADWY